MRYHSTRNDQNFVDSAEAVLEGLAPDGGLYMPCCRTSPICPGWLPTPTPVNLKPRI